MRSVSSSDFRVLFVGYLFPDWLESKIMKQEIRPIQTQRFGLALLDALRSGFDDKVDVLSLAQISDFPHNPLVFAPSAKWRIDNKIEATMVPFLNLVILKHLTRFVATFTFVFQWLIRNKNSKRIIVIHHVQSCKIWGVLFSQFLVPCISISFLTDDIGIPSKWEGVFLKNMRYAANKRRNACLFRIDASRPLRYHRGSSILPVIYSAFP